jgi:hypothetical protein
MWVFLFFETRGLKLERRMLNISIPVELNAFFLLKRKISNNERSETKTACDTNHASHTVFLLRTVCETNRAPQALLNKNRL